jgi:hypothetical protein
MAILMQFGAIFAGAAGWLMLGDNYYGNRIMPGTQLCRDTQSVNFSNNSENAGVSWRWYAGLCTLPVLLALVLLIKLVPESPSYYIRVGRYLGTFGLVRCTFF